MIGLLDADWNLSNSTTLLIPNVEIMKLANYYTTEEKQFCNLLSLDATDLNGYDIIYFVSEKDNPPEIPEIFLRHPNVIFCGSAFNRRTYVPFENRLIDFTLPRPTIYRNALKQKYDDGIKTKVISHVLDDSYYRNYAGKQKLPIPAIKPRKRIFLYDRDFFYEDWKETIEEISERNVTSIMRLHPIICNTLTQYFDMRAYPKISRTNEVILDIKVPFDEISYMFKHYKNLFLADITPSSEVFLPLGGHFLTTSDYCKDLHYKLNFLYSFWSRKIPIKVKCIEPFIGEKNPLINLSHLIETWSALKNKDRTLMERIIKKKVTIEEEELNLFLKYFRSSKNLFLQSYNLIYNRGLWNL